MSKRRLQTREEFQTENNVELLAGFNRVTEGDGLPIAEMCHLFHTYVNEAYIAYVELMIDLNLTGQ